MRVYIDKKWLSDDYMEVSYMEFNEAGELRSTGTEDFSPERFRSNSLYGVKTPTGKKNRGGHNTFDHWESIWAPNAKAARAYAKHKRGENASVYKI